MVKYRILFIAIMLQLLRSTIGAAAADQSPPSNDQAQVTDTVRAMFAALSTEDLSNFAVSSLPISTRSRQEVGLPAMPWST
jgi:hypothetical protein